LPLVKFENKKQMTLENKINIIKLELKNYYDINEINSFINIIFDKLLSLSKIEIHSNKNIIIDDKIEKKINQIIDDLKNEKPIQYIFGETEFFDLKFEVNKNVLIPRPETEELIDWIISNTHPLTQNERVNNINILDIGTGSGCIAISLAKNLPNANVYAIDISENALEIAKKNALKNKVKIIFAKYDILSDMNLFSKNKTLGEKQIFFDIIVSNPPYVRELEKKMMSKNVLNYEPETALFVENSNPLIFYDKICNFANKYLKPKGKIYFEINEYLSKEMIELIKNHNFTNIELKKDINNKDRMIKINLTN